MTLSPEDQFVDFLVAEAARAPINDRYDEIQKVTSRYGHFSIVCGARDRDSGKNVVLKFMGPRASSDPYRSQCFEREHRIGELLIGKENIIQLAGERQVFHCEFVHELTRLPLTLSVPFFALERARESLTAFLLRHRRPRPAYRRLGVLRDVVKGVARLHRIGYCHRDLKPDNIFLFSKGIAKVADLGTCRLHSGVDPIGTSLHYLMPTGDLMYAAPEMYSAAGLDPNNFIAADWFGVGAIMFEALTGQNIYVAIGLRDRHAVKATLAAAADIAGYLKQVGTTSGQYPIPSLVDFSESWLVPLSKETLALITSLIRDLCNFDYRIRLLDFTRILRRLDIAILRAERDHARWARSIAQAT